MPRRRTLGVGRGGVIRAGLLWAARGAVTGFIFGSDEADVLLRNLKVYEPLLVVGLDKFAGLDIRVRVSGGGHTSQI